MFYIFTMIKMYKKTPTTLRSGFTLIELLVVIAIIGVLAAIVLPNVMSFLGKARITEGINNARGIHQAYQQFMVDRNRPIVGQGTGGWQDSNVATNHGEFAGILQRLGFLDNASYFYTPGDPALPEVLPGVPATTADGTTWTINPTFASTPISFEILLGISENNANTQIPYIWSRGGISSSDGRWGNDDPYLTSGGIIVRLNGSANFAESVDQFEPQIYTITANDARRISTTVATTIASAVPTEGGTIVVIGKQAD